MKEIGELVPIWKTNTPPENGKGHENDFLVKLSIENNEIMYGSINWCSVECRYYFEPAKLIPDPNDNNRWIIVDDEAYFSPDGITSLKVSLRQLGILHTRRVFEEGKPQKDYSSQLAKIHPSLVPQQK